LSPALDSSTCLITSLSMVGNISCSSLTSSSSLNSGAGVADAIPAIASACPAAAAAMAFCWGRGTGENEMTRLTTPSLPSPWEGSYLEKNQAQLTCGPDNWYHSSMTSWLKTPWGRIICAQATNSSVVKAR
jgi:hypothetical protein